jgi:hypothetical protein
MVISLGWKIYDWAVLNGESHPSQNTLARMAVVLLIVRASVYFVLDATGSLPLVV